MRLLTALPLLAGILGVQALHFNVQRRKLSTRQPSLPSLVTRATSDSLDLSTYHDMLYTANITLAGVDYLIQLDTGSSDLWIKASSTPIANTNPTSLSQNLTYGAGWAHGAVSFAPVTFAGITVSSQAFLDASSAQNAVLDYGTSGVMGLGFNALSTIDAAVNASGASNGRSLLYNLFYDNPSTPNFIAFSLQRSEDPDADVQGTFSIGEFDANYTKVNSTDAIPTFPPSNPNRWNVLLQALFVGNTSVPLTSQVNGAPAEQAVILLDSGSSYTYAPTEVVNAIYSNVQGASIDADSGQWVVPCTAEIDVAFQINGNIYPLHPLDVVIKSPSAVNVCAGTFIPQDQTAIGSGVVDWIAGDNFLRSVYSVYDFGDFDAHGNMGDPYVKLLALVEPNAASAEFAQQRNTTARTGIVYNAASTTSSATTIALSNSVIEAIDRFSAFLPAALALIAFNTIVVLVLLVGAGIWLCRRRRAAGSGARARKNKGRAVTPLQLEPMATELEAGAGVRESSATYLGRDFGAGSLAKGQYQPVSMALTEDTFVPPSPAFSRYGDGGFPKGIDRPKSVA